QHRYHHTRQSDRPAPHLEHQARDEHHQRQRRERHEPRYTERHPERAAQRRLRAPQPDQRRELEPERRRVEQYVAREQTAERQQREERIHHGRNEDGVRWRTPRIGARQRLGKSPSCASTRRIREYTSSSALRSAKAL